MHILRSVLPLGMAAVAAAASVEFPSASTSASEGTGGVGTLVSVAVRLTGTAVGAQTVDWTANNLPPTDATDYGPSYSGTLSWADGETGVKYIDFIFNHDATVEPDEGFTVELSAPTAGISLGGRTFTLVVIRDDDGPSVPLQADAAAMIKPNGTGDSGPCGAGGGAAAGSVMGLIAALGLVRRRRR